MAQELSNRRDQDFVLHEMLKIEELSKYDKYAEFNKKTIDMIVTEARNLAIKELLPANKPGDEEGCRLENGQVIAPESYKRPFKLYCEGEWLAMADSPEYGGQGMPNTVAMAAGEVFIGANVSFMMYSGLSHGAAKMIEEIGDEKQKNLFLKKMFSGKWGGTMLLTEPEAGSDLGLLTSVAKKNEDGTYSITGNKIFISGGDSDLTENIIHATLARIEGEPEGTKGISLFIVPKIWVNDDGTLGESNDVTVTGLEKKLGIHGNSTCSISLGEKGKCRGYLLGEKNKGLKAMFLMMNEERLMVGHQGFSLGSASYMNAANYAKQRVQGKDLLKSLQGINESVEIINHPDVRRDLLTMKSYVEGMRGFIYYVGYLFDKKALAENQEEKTRYQGLIELLTPIVKAYCTDKGFDVCTTGMQVFGGYGYTKEYMQEQLLRDCKITSIYEGTNGIQAGDLLGRKLPMNNGQPFKDLISLMNKTVSEAKEIESLSKMASIVETAVTKLSETALGLGMNLTSEKILDAFGTAVPFLHVTGDVIIAWIELWRAVTSSSKLENAKKKDIAYYQGQIITAEFFITTILPGTIGKMNGVAESSSSVMRMPEEAF